MSDTREKIRAAINALHSRGERVSATAVRDLIGSGSYSTIGDEIEKWKVAQGAKPEDTAEQIRSLGLDLFQMGTAAGQLAKSHQEHAGSVALAKSSLDFLHQTQRETMPMLHQMLHAALASHEALQLEYNAVSGENRRLQAQVAQLNEQLVGITRDSKAKLDTVVAGFDGIQKRLMLSIDQTRQQVAEPLKVLRDQVAALTAQLNAKTQAFNEQVRVVSTQADVIRSLERRLAEHEGHDAL
jgi:type I site-specific restriction endonuclease